MFTKAIIPLNTACMYVEKAPLCLKHEAFIFDRRLSYFVAASQQPYRLSNPPASFVDSDEQHARSV